MNVSLTALQIEAVATHVRDVAGEDDQLLLDCLEGETDLFRLSSRLLDQIEHDEGNIVALKSQIGDRNERKAAAERRIEARRATIQALMDCAQIDKLPLPEATVTLRKVAPKPIVTDEAALPDDLCRIKRSPDMAAIRAEMDAGRAVSGVTIDNGGHSLAIRRK